MQDPSTQKVLPKQASLLLRTVFPSGLKWFLPSSVVERNLCRHCTGVYVGGPAHHRLRESRWGVGTAGQGSPRAAEVGGTLITTFSSGAGVGASGLHATNWLVQVKLFGCSFSVELADFKFKRGGNVYHD